MDINYDYEGGEYDPFAGMDEEEIIAWAMENRSVKLFNTFLIGPIKS